MRREQRLLTRCSRHGRNRLSLRALRVSMVHSHSAGRTGMGLQAVSQPRLCAGPPPKLAIPAPRPAVLHRVSSDLAENAARRVFARPPSIDRRAPHTPQPAGRPLPPCGRPLPALKCCLEAHAQRGRQAERSLGAGDAPKVSTPASCAASPSPVGRSSAAETAARRVFERPSSVNLREHQQQQHQQKPAGTPGQHGMHTDDCSLGARASASP